MKQLVMILAAAGVCMTLGCEKRVGQAKDADKYDEKIDGPTCVLSVNADENLLADQKKISRKAGVDIEAPVEIEEESADEDTDGEDTTTPESAPEPVPATAPAADVPDTPVAKPATGPRPDERHSDEERRQPSEREM